ncbi:MAG: succinate dehydrogenase/fumarate reductase iron-sulfur subunit [Candidatus Heimdallarchaeota archaeon]
MVTFENYRFDPETDQAPRFDKFQLKPRKAMNVLEALFEIVDTQDGSLAFRYACRGAICGSCGMIINGEPRLACQTLVERLETDIIKLEPLPHLKVLKDLVVDLNPLFEKLSVVMPFFKSDQLVKQDRESSQSPKQRIMIDDAVNCILCELCDAACPIVNFNKDFLGPASIAKAYRFIFDSRDGAIIGRLKKVNTEQGVWGCRVIARCTEVCPKDVGPSRCISAIKKKLVIIHVKNKD